MLEATKVKKLNAAADRIGGYAGALAFLEQLPESVARRVLKPAMQAADLVGQRAAAAEAQKHASKKPKGVHLSATAGAAEATSGTAVIGKVGFFGDGGSHGWLAEHGHRIVTGGTARRTNASRKDFGKAAQAKNGQTGGGRVVGQAPPHPILAPAYAESKGTMESVFASEVVYRADQTATRLAKQTGALS